MQAPFLDTSVLIRFLRGDLPELQHVAARLLEQVEQGKLTVAAPDTVIADAVYVLSSPRLYNEPSPEVAALLLPIVRLPHVRVQNRKALIAALQLYSQGITF